jgi:hypothetical protein
MLTLSIRRSLPKSIVPNLFRQSHNLSIKNEEEDKKDQWFKQRKIREFRQCSDPRSYLKEKKYSCEKEIKVSETGTTEAIVYDLPTIYFNHNNKMSCIPACVTMMPFTNDSPSAVQTYKRSVYEFLRDMEKTQGKHASKNYRDLMIARNAMNILTLDLDQHPQSITQLMDALKFSGPLLISNMNKNAHHSLIIGVDTTQKKPILVKNPVEENESIYKEPHGNLPKDKRVNSFTLQNFYTFKSFGWYNSLKLYNEDARAESGMPLPFLGAINL